MALLVEENRITTVSSTEEATTVSSTEEVYKFVEKGNVKEKKM